MEAWIQSLISLALGPVRSIAQGAADRIASVYRAFTDALGRTRRGFLTWASRGAIWATGQVRHALAVATYLRWLALVDLPRRAADVLNRATAWARDQIAAAKTYLLAELNIARAWLLARVNDALAALSRLRDWTTQRIAEIVAALNRVLSHLFGPLATPERVVAWILAPLITALVRWALDNVDTLAEQAFRRRAMLERQALTLTERILDRLL